MTFDDFWTAWPAGPRKVNKKGCREVWDKSKLDSEAIQIIGSVNWHKQNNPQWKSDANGKNFIPMPTTFLRQQRWRDGTFETKKERLFDKRSVPREAEKLPEMSRYAIHANKVLFQLAYMDRSRGMKPMGDGLKHVLSVRSRIVADAEEALRSGDPWADSDFVDILYTAIPKALEVMR